MYSVQRSALVQHGAAEMFALINDVDAYAEFLPWCSAAAMIEQASDYALASVTIAYRGLNKTFTTRNQFVGQEKIIMTLVDGPFKSLRGSWHCRALDAGACEVLLDLEFNFANPLADKLIAPIFIAIADSMVAAFCRRADDIYPPGPKPAGS